MKNKGRRARRHEGSFLRWIHYSDARQARCIRKLLSAVPDDARIVKLAERHYPFGFYLITRTAYPLDERAGYGPYQATRFDHLGPCSHFFAPTIHDAIKSLAGERVPGIGLPHGFPGQYRVQHVRM